MNIFDLIESSKLGAQSTTDQHTPSPIGSGTTKREAKKKPVTMMGVSVKEDLDEAGKKIKSNFKMPPESVQDRLYRQHQELRKKRGAPDPEYYKNLALQKQAEIDALKEEIQQVKEGILDRGGPKLPKPRNPADTVLRSKVNAAGTHTNKKRQQQLQPKHRAKDPMDEGWKSALAGAALAGSMALGGGAAHAAEPVVGVGKSPDMQMAIDMAQSNARIKYLKSIHGTDAQGKQIPKFHWGKIDLKQDDRGTYIANIPLVVDSDTPNEGVAEGWKSALAGAALAGSMAMGGAGDVQAQQLPDTKARVLMMVDGEVVEKVFNLGPVASPQAAQRTLANELRSQGIGQFKITLERDAPVSKPSVNTRPGPHGARGVSTPGGVVDTTGQIAGDVESGDYKGAAQKAYKTYQNNKNADLGAIGKGEVKDKIIRGIVGGFGLNETDEEDINETIERHLMQMRHAGYDIVQEEKTRLDPKCWTGKKIGNPKTKIKGGVRVNNCVPK